MSFTQRIQRNTIRLKEIFKGKTDDSQSEYARRLVLFRRNNDEAYTFEEGHILLNGESDILAMVDDPTVNTEWLVNMASAVYEYRRTAWSVYGTENRNFNGQTQAILEKILGRLSTNYEEMSAGIKVQLHGKTLWLNDIDPNVVLSSFLTAV